MHVPRTLAGMAAALRAAATAAGVAATRRRNPQNEDESFVQALPSIWLRSPSRARVSRATAKRDLRTGKTIWQIARRPSLRVAPLTAAIETDGIVVGAGISGALVAERLAECGFRVVIVDRRGPCRGSTSASTSLIQFEIDEPLVHLIEKIGARKAERAWRRSAAAVEDLIVRTRRLRIGCDLERRATLYLAGDELGPRDLQREVALRCAIGLPSQYIDREQLLKRVGIDRRGAILS